MSRHDTSPAELVRALEFRASEEDLERVWSVTHTASRKQPPIKLVLSGPMGGYPEQNFPAFVRAMSRLEEAGYAVVSPHSLCDPDTFRAIESAGSKFAYTPEYQRILKACLLQVADADAVAQLPGWVHSNGARAEYRMAMKCGMEAKSVNEWLQLAGAALWAGDPELEPSRYYEGDAGLDLHCAQDVVVRAGAFVDVPCGVKVVLPVGTWGLVTGRSSTLRNKGLLVAQGVIDNGYRGDLFAGVQNLNGEDVEVARGERLAQLIPLTQASYALQLKRVEDYELPGSDRGTRSFGSTGA